MQKDSEKNMSIKKLWKWKAFSVPAHVYIFLLLFDLQLLHKSLLKVNGFPK